MEEERSRIETMARVLKLYEQSNSGTGKEARDLLDKMEKSNPGFPERISAALDPKAAVLGLTLRDIVEHTKMWHLDERALEYAADRTDDDIQRMVRATSKEWRICTACVRAAIAVWIAMTMRVDLGLDPFGLTAPENDIGPEASCPEEQQVAQPRKRSNLSVPRL